MLDKICQWNSLALEFSFICDNKVGLLWLSTGLLRLLCCLYQFLISFQGICLFVLNLIYWCKVVDNIPFPLMSVLSIVIDPISFLIIRFTSAKDLLVLLIFINRQLLALIFSFIWLFFLFHWSVHFNYWGFLDFWLHSIMGEHTLNDFRFVFDLLRLTLWPRYGLSGENPKCIWKECAFQFGIMACTHTCQRFI